jgi:hypothetical protein
VEPSEDSGLTVCETLTVAVESKSTPSSPFGLPPDSGEDLGRVGLADSAQRLEGTRCAEVARLRSSTAL